MKRDPADPIRAVHVIAGLDAAHGGPSYSVPRLCRAVAGAGIETMLLSVAGRAVRPDAVLDAGYHDCRFAWDHATVPILRGLRVSSGLARALNNAAHTVDVIHNHGLWLLPNLEAGWAATRANTPLVVAPRGMLNPAALAFSRLKKRAFWHFVQGPAIRQAGCMHATSDQEYDDIRAMGLLNAVAIIPNGVDIPERVPAAPEIRTDRVVLSLGRIHPKKGLDHLVRAWARVEPVHPGWRLRIVGPEELDYAGELRAIAAAEGLSRLSIEGRIHGEEKLAAFREAELFVLPSRTENFAMTVAEALAMGTPVIATRGTPWADLDAQGCGWWIDHGVEPLASALNRAMMMPRDVLATMGAKGRRWMARDFSWERIGRDMGAVYNWLAGRSEAPETVRFA